MAFEDMRKGKNEPIAFYLERVHLRWEEMRDMYTEGTRVPVIATHFGISVARCYQILHNIGEIEPRRRLEKPRTELERVLSYYYPGCSRRQLARISGVKLNRLLYLIRLAPTLGVELPWRNNDSINCD